LRRFISRISLLTSLALLVSNVAVGSGFSIFEQGAKASAMAGAFVATADDPSAIFYNPAGLAQQRSLSVIGGATFITFSNEFTGDPNNDLTSGVEGNYDRHLFVIPNAYGVMPIGDNLTFGIGTFAGFGLRTDWQDPWAGRFISRDVDLKTVSLNPTVAWQTTDGRLALGGGIEYRRARVTLNRNTLALNPFTGRIDDVANAYLSSEWDHGIGWNAGVLFKITPAFRIGASYRHSMDIDLEGTADISQIPTGNAQFDTLIRAQLPPDQGITTTIPFPAMAAIGVAGTFGKWDVEFDITHATWSRFEELRVDFEQTPAANLVREQNWEDSSAFRLGANGRVHENWDVRLGAVYDQTPQPVEAVSPLLPDSDRVGVTFGFGWHRGPLSFDFSNMVLHFKDRSTEGRSPDQFEGTYETDTVLLSVNFGYRF
jgi:long-chain fatty acid transport protein